MPLQALFQHKMFKGRVNMYLLAAAASILLIVLDQTTKYWARTMLQPGGSVIVIPGILDFRFQDNRGAAFGIMQDQQLFLILFTFIVLGLGIYFFVKLPKEKPYQWVRLACVFVFSGAVGNLIDRVFLRYVVDFIQVRFMKFPIFNVADILVVSGAFLLCFLYLFIIKEKTADE